MRWRRRSSGSLLIGVATSGVLAGKPIGAIVAFLFGLDPAVFVDVEELTAEARRALLLPTLLLAIVLAAVAIPSALVLAYYSM